MADDSGSLKRGWVLCGKHPISFNHASRADGGHLLFFASPKKSKQKKGDCGCRFGYAKLPSLHTIFRADKKLAASLLKQFCPFPPKNRVPLGCASREGALW